VPERIEAGPLLSAAGSLALFASLFVDWYGDRRQGFSAWTVFEVWDLALAALALVGVAAVAGQLGAQLPVRPRVLPLLGVAALVIVVSQILNHPPAGVGRGLETGAWIGLAGSLAMVGGALLGVARVSVEVRVEEAGRPPAPGDRRRPAATAREAADAPDLLAANEVAEEAAAEAAAVEPEVQDELYPERERHGPIGAEDPEVWRSGPDDETRRIE
jgi:hypothetical protein